MNGMIHGRQSPVPAWNRWEAALESSCDRADPYAGVTVSVSYRGPGGRVVHGTAFWDGGRTYRIRCMFPEPGEWAWETRCSDPADEGLHGRRGVVLVSRYEGDNPLYRRGYLRVSESGRYLQHDDGTPFLWVGDTSWLAYVRAVQPEWERYVDDRVAKGFTVLVVSCTCSGGPSDQTDAEGNSPFIGDGATRWNPAFWSNFDKKVGYANDRGAVVVVTGVAWGERMHLASLEEVRAFARNLSARLAFNFVILSPLQDWAEGSDEGIHLAGEEIHRATPYQLVTQHPKRRPMPELVLGYHTQPYIDFTSVQTG
ncbi:MAG: DUF4038 domain-containing protein, partial [Gemmatimonadetes bacterium]|nr:DUF4038 domain-containing protein [Gemmatimonadota bacterium]